MFVIASDNANARTANATYTAARIGRYIETLEIVIMCFSNPSFSSKSANNDEQFE